MHMYVYVILIRLCPLFDCGWADNEGKALAINILFIMYLQMCASELLLHRLLAIRRWPRVCVNPFPPRSTLQRSPLDVNLSDDRLQPHSHN